MTLLVNESKVQCTVYCSRITTAVYDGCDYPAYVLNSLALYDATWPSVVNTQIILDLTNGIYKPTHRTYDTNIYRLDRSQPSDTNIQ